MEYDRLKAAIDLLREAASRLQSMVETTPAERASNLTVAEAMETVKKAVAEMSAAVNPPLTTQIPQELLDKAEALGIPLDDLEVRVAISSHHPSQLAGVLQEIESRAANIKRRREYFLVRLPDMPVEQLGPRVPVVTAADLKWPQEATPPEVINAIKAKYGIDKLMLQRTSRPSLFERIKEANEALAKAQPAEPVSDPDDDEIPF
ncbi:hypothetical protein [Kamptonema formosum]|uniref:hypothetical protein n=1 Tax=Kamptonema formosum TaxID=331992 RepID=UPI000348A76D|nr:hypothetical protein [Oscillatoria sp. PCC 10802]